MKRLLIFSLLLFASVIESFGQCNNGTGSNIYTKQATYNCHQYVKAALIGGYVNLSTGKPTSNENQYASLYTPYTIATDQNFIQVCSKSDADAVVPVGHGADHSAIIRNDGIFASTPNGQGSDYIYSHQNPRTFTTACNQEWYAAIPDIKISGPSAVNQGANITLSLTNNGQSFPSFLQLHKDRWTYEGSDFTFQSSSSTSITLKAKNVTGSSEIKYELKTGCNAPDFFRTKTVQILPNCTGTLNGGPLYTFNTVPGGQNQVEMYLDSWTWVKTSGNVSWSTSNGGKNMTFSISSGCATFNAYNASCNLNLTFCRASSSSSYTVTDAKTSEVVREGIVGDRKETNKRLAELPPGEYTITVDGHRTRYVKSNKE